MAGSALCARLPRRDQRPAHPGGAARLDHERELPERAGRRGPGGAVAGQRGSALARSRAAGDGQLAVAVAGLRARPLGAALRRRNRGTIAHLPGRRRSHADRGGPRPAPAHATGHQGALVRHPGRLPGQLAHRRCCDPPDGEPGAHAHPDRRPAQRSGVGAAQPVAQVAVSRNDPDAMQKIIRKQVGESDYDFLRHIALENGWEMLVDHSGPLGGHQLRFLSLAEHLMPDLTLKYGQSLIDFTPRLSKVGQVVGVSARIWQSDLKIDLSVTALLGLGSQFPEPEHLRPRSGCQRRAAGGWTRSCCWRSR